MANRYRLVIGLFEAHVEWCGQVRQGNVHNLNTKDDIDETSLCSLEKETGQGVFLCVFNMSENVLACLSVHASCV